MMNQKISLGRVVLFAFEKNGGGIEERPARIVRAWDTDTGCANLVVDIDGPNDAGLIHSDERARGNERAPLSVLRTSVLPSSDPTAPQANTWRWPPRVT